MKDGIRNKVLQNESFINSVNTEPKYVLLDLGNFPGLVRIKNNGKKIQGELYEVNKLLIKTLDKIEVAPDLFRLEPVEIINESRPTFAYFFKHKLDKIIIYDETRWKNNLKG